MKRLALILSCCAVAVFVAAPVQGEDFDVYILSGQSNMDGLTTFEGTHFDTAAILEFGQRMADAMAELQEESGSAAPAVKNE